jgi:hypothetical protein
MDCQMRNPSRRSFMTDGGDGKIGPDDMAAGMRDREVERLWVTGFFQWGFGF